MTLKGGIETGIKPREGAHANTPKPQESRQAIPGIGT